MTDIKRTKSRRRTPWTDSESATPLQAFIDGCTERDYVHRHPAGDDTGEVGLLNSYELHCCRHCGSERIRRYGFFRNGAARYLCNDCGRTFGVTTNTIFDNHKISVSEWIGFLLDIMGFGSFSLTAKVNRNSNNTTRYWIDKTFLLLDDIQKDIILEGTVWLDETFLKVRNPDIEKKADGLEYRGISRNQMCIGIARDKTHAVFYFEGFGKPTGKRTLELFGNHIRPGSMLVHDMERAHGPLVEQLQLQSTVYNSKELKKLQDKDNPLDPVNELCRLAQMFLRAHSGFLRDDLQGYLNLFSILMNPPDNKYQKIEKMLDLGMTKPILLRYRR